jgi:hypothetical protein
MWTPSLSLACSAAVGARLHYRFSLYYRRFHIELNLYVSVKLPSGGIGMTWSYW